MIKIFTFIHWKWSCHSIYSVIDFCNLSNFYIIYNIIYLSKTLIFCIHSINFEPVKTKKKLIIISTVAIKLCLFKWFSYLTKRLSTHLSQQEYWIKSWDIFLCRYFCQIIFIITIQIIFNLNILHINIVKVIFGDHLKYIGHLVQNCNNLKKDFLWKLEVVRFLINK